MEAASELTPTATCDPRSERLGSALVMLGFHESVRGDVQFRDFPDSAYTAIRYLDQSEIHDVPDWMRNMLFEVLQQRNRRAGLSLVD